MESNEAILGGKDFIDCVVSELKQRIKIICGGDALDYFSDSFAFRFRPLKILRHLVEGAG